MRADKRRPERPERAESWRPKGASVLTNPAPGGEQRGERHARAGAQEEPEDEGRSAAREQVAEDEEDRERREHEARLAHEREGGRGRQDRQQDDKGGVQGEPRRQHIEPYPHENQEEDQGREVQRVRSLECRHGGGAEKEEVAVQQVSRPFTGRLPGLLQRREGVRGLAPPVLGLLTGEDKGLPEASPEVRGVRQE